MPLHTDDDLVHDHIARLIKLEDQVEMHGKSLATLVPSVTAIEGHIKALKWLAIGATAVTLIQKFGLVDGLEKVLKLL